MKFAASFLLFCFLFLVSGYLLLAPSARAQTCQAPPSLSTQETINNLNKCAIEKDVFDDKLFNLNQIIGTSDSLYTMLVGKSLAHPETNTVTAGTGAVAQMGRMVASLYTAPPVSGVQYFAGQIQKFNPAQPVYAQAGTVGFAALSPVEGLWRVFRNAAYVGFVIIFVIIGFMIMFRAHVSPQTVATIQDSIPRLVVALILVTFSFAIAGLFIDLMFLFLNIVINFLPSNLISVQEANRVAFEQSILGVIVAGWGDIVTTTAEVLKHIIDEVININFLILDDIIESGLAFIGGIVVAIAVLFIMFRIFLMLLMSYVMIIILTMAAPFFFLIQALPGNAGAKEWFKQMAANVAVFPTVALMIIFAGILAGIKAFGGAAGGGAIPEGEVLKFPLLAGGFDANKIGKFIALGFLLATPEAANMVKNAISGGRGGGAFGGAALGGAIGGAIGAGWAPVGAGLGKAGRAAWERGPIAERLRAGQLLREKRAYRRAGLTMPGTKSETEPGAEDEQPK